MSTGSAGFPVTGDDGKVIGVVTETDLLALAAGRHHRGHRAAEQATAGDLMSHPAVTVSPDDPVKTAARLMRKHRLQRLPVVDRGGHLAGIVSRSDVLSVFERSDEEIRREVTQDVIADGFFTDPARFTVTVHNGIVTLEGAAGQRRARRRHRRPGRAPRGRGRRPRPLHLSGPFGPLRPFGPGTLVPDLHGRNALAAGAVSPS